MRLDKLHAGEKDRRGDTERWKKEPEGKKEERLMRRRVAEKKN